MYFSVCETNVLIILMYFHSHFSVVLEGSAKKASNVEFKNMQKILYDLLLNSFNIPDMS